VIPERAKIQMRRRYVSYDNLRGEIIITATMLLLFILAALLIANLIGAIHVFG
jgi:hypothetical protein